MKFVILALAAVAVGEPQAPCPLPRGFLAERRAFTNADLEAIAACRDRTGAVSQPGTAPPERAAPRGKPPATTRAAGPKGAADESDWRARWRSVERKARLLRREASELRREAAEAPRDPRKRPTGRRSPSLLIARAEARESEARELEDEFRERARRAGALPGWLRP